MSAATLFTGPVFTAPVVMGTIAAASALGALYVVTRRVSSDQGIYARRLAATMLGAMALILALFTYALASMGSG